MLKIEVGKSYIDAHDRQIDISHIERSASFFYPVFVATNGWRYNLDGERVSDPPFGGADPIAHLVKSFVPNQTEHQTESTELHLKEGMSYHSKSGKLVKILFPIQLEYKPTNDATSSWVTAYLGDNNCIYTANGYWIGRIGQRADGVSREYDHLSYEYGKKSPESMIPIALDVVNYTKMLIQVSSDLKQEGHCGESTNDRIARQRWNSVVDAVCDNLLAKTLAHFKFHPD